MTDWIARAAVLQPQVRNWFAGHWQQGKPEGQLEKYGPRDGRLLYVLGTTNEKDIDLAVRDARRAFADGRWAKRPLQHRKEVLLKLAALVLAHRDELALLESLDVGKPISDALSFDVPTAAAIIRACAEGADHVYGKVYGVDSTCLSYQLYRPVGVTAGIIGWNFPLMLAAGKIGPSLAMGNSLILKPSELTSLSAARLAELALEAGVPEGVLNVIHGDFRAGTALAHHADVDLLTFTGSTHTGKRLLVAAGQSNMKRLILECGGKAPNLVFEDAPDLNAIADSVLGSAFWNQGQVCTASSRLLVQESIKQQLVDLLIEKTANLTIGDPLQESTRFGALVSRAHRRKVIEYVDGGVKEGARIVYQSEQAAPFADGFYAPPSILDRVSPQQKIAKEEVFGPVLSVISFQDESHAIEIANGTIYGLSAVLWTRDLARVHRLTQAVQAGWIVANTSSQPRGGPGEGVLSIGGHKQSGLGVEGGLEGLAAYTTQTAVQVYC